MIIYAIRVSNNKSRALGTEIAVAGYCVCARLPYAMEIYSKSDNAMSVRAYSYL